jgi:hypothetical protein
MLFLGVLLYYFYAIKAINWHFKVGIYTFLAFCAILMLSQGIGKILFFCSKISSPLPLGTINYCSLQTIGDSLLGTNQTLQNKLNACYDQYGFQIIKKNINSQSIFGLLLKAVIAICGFCYAFVYQIAIGLSKKITCIFSPLLFCFAFLTENILVHNTAFTAIFLYSAVGTIVPNKVIK